MAARRQSTESSSTVTKSRLSPMPCEMGTMVFARTSASDPFEVAKIIKVDSFEECCYALFENGKKHWVSFTNMQKKDLSLVLNICCLCQGKARSQFKPLLKCVVCHLGFHRKCHNPIVLCIDAEDATRWQCQICIYASSSSSSSSSSSGHNDVIFSKKASKANQSKQLPKTSESSSDRDAGSDDELHRSYRQRKLSCALESLTWDKNHLTNSENCYCYCGQTGRWDDGMLRCTGCLQWFHRGCISLKTGALVAGDLLYVFFCSNCFKKEFYYRLQVTWKDLAHLALFNLSRERVDVGFFDIGCDIVPWVRRHWWKLHTGKLNSVAQREREKNLLEALEKNPSWFEQSSLLKTKWQLKETKILTAPPSIDRGRFQLRPSRRKIERLLTTLVPVTGCDDLEETSPRKRKKFNAESDLQEQKKAKIDSSEPTSSSVEDGSQSSSVILPSTSKRNKVLRHMLDEMIPAPSSYDGLNHPFKTEIEKEDEMKTVECQRKALNVAVRKAVARFDASTNLPPSDAKKKGDDRLSAGELFNFDGVDMTNRPKRRKSVVKKTVIGSFAEDHSEDDLDDIVIRCFGAENMTGRIIGKRVVEGSGSQLLVEWNDEDRT